MNSELSEIHKTTWRDSEVWGSLLLLAYALLAVLPLALAYSLNPVSVISDALRLRKVRL